MTSENSAVTMNASQNQNFVPQALPAERVVTLALLMETALLVSSVEDTESVSSPMESFNQNKVEDKMEKDVIQMNNASPRSVMLVNASRQPLLDSRQGVV